MDETRHGERRSLELRDYLRVVRRRWKMLLVITVVVTGAIFGFTQTRPSVYEAKASVLLDAGYARTVVYADSTIIPNVDEQATTELDLMRSEPVQDAIAEELGYEPEVAVAAEQPRSDEEKTRSMSVTGIGSTAEEAELAANDFARTYVRVRKDLINEDLKDTIAQNNETLESLDEQVAAAEKEIEDLQNELAGDLSTDDRRVKEAKLRRLTEAGSVAAINQRQAEINARNDILEAALAANSGERSIFRVSFADKPDGPVSPVPGRDFLIALGIGLALGLIAIFLRDYYDDTLLTKEDLDRATNMIPVLSMVPKSDMTRKDSAEIESLAHPKSAASEAYRNLRTSLEFASLNHKISLIHVTSSLPGEGKTTTAVNLAVTMANAEKRVVLVDADLRRPRVHEYFDMDNEQGFTSVLLGNCSLQDALQRPTDTPNVLVLTSGPPPPNPSELLSSRAAEDLLTTLTEPADIVIVDSPPLIPVSDSVVLAGYAHSTLLVVAAKSTSRRSLGRSLEMLSQIDAPLEGIVFNRVGAEASYTGGYGYGGDSYLELSANQGSWFKRIRS
jgi:capsular exopolysaccharide synthesis family protein